jgi:sec-independent protein translocase protein TatC
MPLVQHLSELRRRAVISAAAVAVGATVAFFAYGAILHVLLRPYCGVLPAGQRCSLLVTDPLEPLALRLKIALWGGAVLASPVVMWQLWRFITPALHPKEKRYAIPFVAASLMLFALGGLVAMTTFPQALHFLIGIGGTSLTTMFNPTKYLRLIVLMIVAFGVAFEFPVLLVFLELAGVLSTAKLRSWRRWAIVAIAGTAAIITPSADPISMLAMALPMWVFYEAAILVGRILHR